MATVYDSKVIKVESLDFTWDADGRNGAKGDTAIVFEAEFDEQGMEPAEIAIRAYADFMVLTDAEAFDLYNWLGNQLFDDHDNKVR